MAEEKKFDRPFPALTPSQRYHLEVYGYVVVENVLTPDEVATLREALQKLKRDLLAAEDPTKAVVRGARFAIRRPYHHYLASILEADPAIAAYATHARLVGMAEELIGGEARLVEFNAHINCRDPSVDLSVPPKFGFHRGSDIPFASHVKNGLYHCNFVKTLTTLTDLGPEDGGTVVIAGSHKVDAPEADIFACAYENRSLIHPFVAPAGSALLFSETLIHATGQIRSDRERVIIIAGYGSRLFPWWDGGSISEEFKRQIPSELETLFHGRAHWTRGPKYRTLHDPADARPFALGKWWER